MWRHFGTGQSCPIYPHLSHVSVGSHNIHGVICIIASMKHLEHLYQPKTTFDGNSSLVFHKK